MNYIKLNLPPTICDLVKCQELIDRKRLSNEEKDEVIFTDKYDTPKKVEQYMMKTEADHYIKHQNELHEKYMVKHYKENGKIL